MNIKMILQDLKDRKITPEQARKLMETNKNTSLKINCQKREPIAIIGISGRFPGADNMNAYWDNLTKGKSSICEIPKSRWDMKKYFDPQIGKEGHMYCKWMGMLDDVEYFDPMFFEITPSEAEAMDPQHRLFLQEAYRAFEDAGYSKRNLNNRKCGVYLGIVDDDYSNLGEQSLSATGNSNAIGASRISYFLNLKGPAIAIDTACSSSMVGIHLAVNALNLNDIDMALVGGSCLYLTPESYISMCETGMLSPEGKCKTFDNSADGFVPGEGVAALVLKRLSDAQRDHDHIYGCIIASGMNQDGKTNGITAPNMGSQKNLETTLYADRKIDPESITYAEFHGTGTKLGDPIELQALASAFREKTDKKNFCAIGSVKSNLGHTSAAGGIAGIEKILLSMQHKQLVPTIHVDVPNEHFDFENSPFFINRERKPWESKDGSPLRACINSFGFSGTNVHLVLEEYKESKQLEMIEPNKFNIFTLSAKNKTQLKIYVKEVLSFLEGKIENTDSFFYTFQDGREAMEQRLAVIVSSIEELSSKLKHYLKEGSSEADGIFESKLSRNQIKVKESTYAIQHKSQSQETAVKAEDITETYLFDLAKQWLQGEIIDWSHAVYGGRIPYKMSVPTYPFEKEAYWLTKEEKKESMECIHPIVHQNVSDFSNQCFRSSFTGKEFFLADHMIQGRKILPATAILEMARAAGSFSSEKAVMGLKDIVWLKSVDYEKCQGNVKILLYPQETEEEISQAEFEVVTGQENSQTICAEGTILYGESGKGENSLSIEQIQKDCTEEVNVTDFYNNISKTGIQYGSSFQAVKQLHFNKKEAVAVVSLLESAYDKKMVLNPALVDAALQSVSVLLKGQITGAVVPFSIDKIQIYDAVPEECLVYSCYAGDKASMKFNVSICDKDGNCVVKLKGLFLKESKEPVEEKKNKLTYFTPSWKEKEIAKSYASWKEKQAILLITQDKKIRDSWEEELEPAYRRHLFSVLVTEQYKQESEREFQCDIRKEADWSDLLKAVKKQGYSSASFVFHIVDQKDNIQTKKRVEIGFEAVLHLCKALIQEKWSQGIKLLYFINNFPVVFPEDYALAGMFRGIQTENAEFQFRVVGVSSHAAIKEYIKITQNELAVSEASCQVSYVNGRRMVYTYLEEKKPDKKENRIGIKEGGTYLITGGMGGVGYMTASYVAETKHTNLILTGRSPLDDKKKEKLKKLSEKGCYCEYLQTDIAEKGECRKLIAHIDDKYGSLSGVFHSAGVIRDALIWKKTMEDSNAVFSAKIYGTKNLDEEIGNRNLDFMILYSSVASALGNLGQVDYCYGNSFMDNFAFNRNMLMANGMRKGKTVSINWPLWADGGMEIDLESQQWMENSLGLVSIQRSEGMASIEAALNLDASEVMVFKGDIEKVRKVIRDAESFEKQEQIEIVDKAATISEEEWEDKAVGYFTEVISEKTKIKKEKLDVDAPFGDYGIDSIMILSITRSLEKTFGSLSKTIFFEYGTIRELAGYFLKNHSQKLIQKIQSKEENSKTENVEAEGKKSRGSRHLTRRMRNIEDAQKISENVQHEIKKSDDIAIIGISGKYPMADDLNEFWENLVQGRDCIAEIPSERWDNEKYFNPDKNQLGTTYSKWGGFINDVDKFDPLFFNIPPVEAEFLDPQVRLYLESAWHAMEDAGYTRESLSGQNVGVYVGVMYGMYQLYNGEIRNQIVPASSSYAGIANRVSYFFDFHGPSMAVDTMCSSSLTALHLACESLKKGETDVAFVGGVNLTIHPNKYLLLSFGKFASTDGKCRSFGKGGDGYVPGEGVGTVILKPLKQAVKDKDQIYAVIKGTAINAGGKTSGFTVPSPVAQSEVIASAYKEAKIAPESISYIESHGTGTSLGDPIEIEGLNKVFGNCGLKPKSCPIGALKSNIGHLEGASGLAGLTKILLQMKHRKLVPSIHSDQLNPYIDFEHSPFYVQHKYEDWKERTYLENGQERNERRAGVSCFGAGGANAHVLLEEYKEAVESSIQAEPKEEKQIYLFSAKNLERLQESVSKYISFFEGEKKEDFCLETLCTIFAEEAGIPVEEIQPECNFEEYGISLSSFTALQNWMLQERGMELDKHMIQNIHTIQELAQYVERASQKTDSHLSEISGRQVAYMLQNGRESMEERLAVIADSLDELLIKLKAWLAQEEISGIFTGNILDYKTQLKSMTAKAEKHASIEEMLERKEYTELAKLWTAGAKINWKQLYGSDCPAKISLPLYPFAKEHYWVGVSQESEKETNKANVISPLLHKNISDISGLKFACEFTGNEKFLKDHVVSGMRILPAAVYMEMVRTAVRNLIKEEDSSKHVALKNLVWMAPATVTEDGLKIVVKFDVVKKEQLLFQIYDAKDSKKVYCQGAALFIQEEKQAAYDVNTLRQETNSTVIPAEILYEYFRQEGIVYGAYMQGIEEIFQGTQKVLARLNAGKSSKEVYFMNPVILDSALQAAAGFGTIESGKKKEEESQKAQLPFALEQIDFYASCSEKMWAYLTLEEGDVDPALRKINIVILNENGEICAKLRNMAFRRGGKDTEESLDSRLDKKCRIYIPKWKKEEVCNKAGINTKRYTIVFTKQPEIWKTSSLKNLTVYPVSSKETDEDYMEAATKLLEYFQKMSKETSGDKVIIQIGISEAENSLLTGLDGLLKSIHLENPNMITQMVELEKGMTRKEMEYCLNQECYSGVSSHVSYQNNKRYVYTFESEQCALSVHEKGQALLWKNKGVYLITGGAGGLGLIFAEHIAKMASDAVIILAGRSKQNVEELMKKAGITEAGVTVKYICCDMTSHEHVADMINHITAEYGYITGIIHSAGIVQDNLFPKKTKEEMMQVLQSKIKGLVSLDRAVREQKLDFLLIMSSTASLKGNIGQTDYAAANGFMDKFAEWRNKMQEEGKRQGVTCSVNWPLWKEGGMQIEQKVLDAVRNATGMEPLGTDEAFAMLEYAVSQKLTHFVPLEGNQKKLEQWLNKQESPEQSIQKSEEKSAEAVDDRELKKAFEEHLKKLLSENMNLPTARIDVRLPLEEYGLTSIMTMELTDELEKEFGSLSKTLFFEYQSLRELAEYFCNAYYDKVCELTGYKKKEMVQEKKTESFVPKKPSVSDIQEKNGWNIAVVGLAGEYPKAENIDVMWENIKNGKDCISEISGKRWNHDKYYDPDKTKADKTYAKWGGFLEDAECFDSLFFHISPMEAEGIDPQERRFLQCVYHAMEDSGYTKENISKDEKNGLKSNVGVFVGVMYEEYQLYGAQAQERGHLYTLNGSEASIANRVSYTYGFHGPSMSVDSMCSSSLSALHLACRSILDGECSMAVAGGVNLSLHPNKFLMLGQSRFMSTKGRCETFGKDGDGYVPGEGVGAVILKPLYKAVEDGDHIYGVIKGSAVNHGGKTNGYTVPNPKAQTGVILDAWKCAGINPRAVSYIEAHGTGTSLGDPIEITGLTHAFDTVTKDRQFLNIGSIKSNIGHCESAAGIAGLTKILLQMKYGKIAPSIHSEILNPNIRFEDSPCVVPQKLTDWIHPVLEENGVQKEYPFLAGLSAFGAGGTNAHVIIEEFINQNTVAADRTEIPLILLSARTKEQLQQKAKDLLDWISHNEENLETGVVTITDMAYTLMTGREEMEERAAFTADSVEQLSQRLSSIAEEEYNDVYYGKAARSNELLDVFDMDDDMAELVDRWMRKRKYDKIAEIWIKGFHLGWQNYFSKYEYRKISLPLYPFQKQRCWRPDREKQMETAVEAVERIHPLIQMNTSDFTEQRYTTVFNGKEVFLEDHKVEENRTLPAVVYLEMVYEGFLDALHWEKKENQALQFTDVLWVAPCVFKKEEIKAVHTAFVPSGENKAEFKIYSGSILAEEETQEIYCTGSIELVESQKPKEIKLQKILEEDGFQNARKEQIYQSFAALGIEYGPGQQSLEKIQKNKDHVFARLEQPEFLQNRMKEYALYPAIMDGALQAAIAMPENSPVFLESIETEEKKAVSVPFMIKSITVYETCRNHMWAELKESSKDGKLSISLIDDNGKTCISMNQICYKEVKNQNKDFNVMLWKPTEYLLEKALCQQKQPESACIFMVGCDKKLIQQVMESRYWDECIVLSDTEKPVSLEECHKVFESVYAYIKEKMSGNKRTDTLIQVAVGDIEENRLFECTAGILKTMFQENPNVKGQMVRIEAGCIDKLEELKKCTKYSYIPVIHLGKQNTAVTYEQVKEIPEQKNQIVFEDNGVYLITGGFGGLGKIFAREAAKRTTGAEIVLAARGELNDEKRSFMKEIEDLGAGCSYYQADVTNQSSVRKLMESIRKDYGRVDGIIHCAGLVRDNFIIRKPMEEFQKVLAPKVDGTWYLDEESKDMPLKFFALFSSFTAVTGNMGQADYALANAFLDSFAGYRNHLLKNGRRSGITISFNWPFWKEGGIALEDSFVLAMKKKSGMYPLETESGVQAFLDAFAVKADVIAPIMGESDKIKDLFKIPERNKEKTKKIEESVESEQNKKILNLYNAEDRKEKITSYLLQVFSEILMMEKDMMDVDTIFEEFGIDSIFVMKITERLEKDFGTLPKTLLFEYQTIRTLSEYMEQEYTEQVEKLFSEEQKPYEAEKKTLEFPIKTAHRFLAKQQQNQTQISTSEPEDEIAIIGISGSYAQSDDLKELWENLKQAKDCITEIPKERWNYEEYFNPDKDHLGTIYTKWGGFLRKVDEFDPLFFHIYPSYAEIMDPQERIFLETAYHAMEDAGYTKKMLGYNPGGSIKRNVGVFVGVMNEEYQLYAAEEQLKGHPVIVSSNTSSVANRVSYYFDFHGPSLTIDTMCSSSLVAVHLACQSIRNKDCEMAVAGGVNVMIHPNKYLTISQSKFASTNGRCMSFGKGGDGYVPGEGTGALILKAKRNAIEDGDHIYGIIKATSVNHGGKTSGYTVPNPNAQAEVIRTVLDKAGISAREVSYVEAHGTGTALGDPIEIRALTKAFSSDTKDTGFCAIGSIKSNIGHCESASGVAAISKVLLQMKYKQLVPSIHAEELNPNIDFGHSPFRVQRTLEEWKRPIITEEGIIREGKRIAGISSFGAGGTNAHVIIEEYEESDYKKEDRSVIIALSCETEKGLKQEAFNLKKAAQENPMLSLQDISYTLLKGRESFENRAAFTTDSLSDMVDKLDDYLNQKTAGIYVGSFKGKTNQEMQTYVLKCVEEEQLKELCEAWVNGADIENAADKLLPDGKRISLPGYVFNNERYWIDIDENTCISQKQNGNIQIFDGTESFLRDHIVNGKKILPGAEILELIRKEAESFRKSPVSIMENIMWMSKAVLPENGKLCIKTEFSKDEAGNYEFKLSDSNAVCARGNVDWKNIEVPEVNVGELKEIEQACIAEIEENEFYKQLESAGLFSGSSFRVVKHIFADEQEGYAVLRMPEESDEADNILRPSMLNGIFQSVSGILSLGAQDEEERVTMLPFALERMELYKPIPEECRVYIQKVQTISETAEFSILVVDASYQPVLYLENFMLKTVRTEMKEKAVRNYYGIQWETHSRTEYSIKKKQLFQDSCIWLFGDSVELYQQISTQLDGTGSRILFIQPGNGLKQQNMNEYQISYGEAEDFERLTQMLGQQGLMPDKIIFVGTGNSYEERMQNGIYALFHLSQALLQKKPEKEIQLLFVYPCGENEIIPEYSGISGFAKTIHMENPLFCYKVIQLHSKDRRRNISQDAEAVLEEFFYPEEDTEVIYSGNVRRKKEIKKIPAAQWKTEEEENDRNK